MSSQAQGLLKIFTEEYTDLEVPGDRGAIISSSHFVVTLSNYVFLTGLNGEGDRLSHYVGRIATPVPFIIFLIFSETSSVIPTLVPLEGRGYRRPLPSWRIDDSSVSSRCHWCTTMFEFGPRFSTFFFNTWDGLMPTPCSVTRSCLRLPWHRLFDHLQTTVY